MNNDEKNWIQSHIEFADLYDRLYEQSKSIKPEDIIPEQLPMESGDEMYMATYDDEFGVVYSYHKLSLLYAPFNNLVKYSVLPETKIICDEAFRFSRTLESIELSNNIIKIGQRAFANCISLKSITIPNSIIQLSAGVFENCNKLEEVILPKGLKELGWGVFSGCESLKSLSIPDSVTNIEDEAFVNCTSLELINLPSKLEFIGDNVFTNCPNLKPLILEQVEQFKRNM